MGFNSAFEVLIKLTTVGNAHGIKLVISIPLKTAEQHFTFTR